jgi:quercetin dioxygenase-like cupin family protein
MSTDIFQPIKLGKEVFHPKSYDERTFEMDWTIDEGGKVPPHFHHYSDEHFKIIKGEILFQVDGEKITKKEGDVFFVPKGTTHSVTNTHKGQSAMAVQYMPCADIHKMFEILATLNKSNPGSMLNMMKYFYLAPRLGLKGFSTLSPAWMMRAMNGSLSILGKLSGWDKLLLAFK